MKRRTLLAQTLVLLALMPACGGGQTGDLSGENGKNGSNTSGGTGCEDHATDIRLDDAAALGFSAASVLTFVEGRFDSPITWQLVNGVTYSPSASQSTLSLTLTSLGKAQLVHSTPPASGQEGGATIGYLCPPDRVRVAVHAELSTADGALQESFETSVDAASEHLALFDHALAQGELAGTFSATPKAVGGPTAKTSIVGFSMHALVAPGGIAGDFTAQLSSIGPEVSSVSSLTFARFPDDPACPTQNGALPALPVTADNPALGFTGTEALARVASSGALPLRWSTTDSTKLTLEASDLGTGCLGTNPFQYSPSAPNLVTYPVTLKATTGDGKLQGSYAASLVTWPATDGNGYLAELQLSRQFATKDVAQSGFSNVDVPADAQRLGLAIQALYDGTNASGSVRLDALVDPPCLTDPQSPMTGPDGSMSAPGCSGTMVTALVSGAWGAP